MHTTTAQNKAHRNDIAWTRHSGSFKVGGETFVSEHRNHFTGQTIRKSWRMTGMDWFIFDADDNQTGRAHSLTAAKWDAAH